MGSGNQLETSESQEEAAVCCFSLLVMSSPPTRFALINTFKQQLYLSVAYKHNKNRKGRE